MYSFKIDIFCNPKPVYMSVDQCISSILLINQVMLSIKQQQLILLEILLLLFVNRKQLLSSK